MLEKGFGCLDAPRKHRRNRLYTGVFQELSRAANRTGIVSYCRILRSRFTDAWDMPGAPKPLPMPLQSMLVAEARTRIERAKAMEWMGYYVGQIVGDMKEETSTRGVIHDMLLEFAEAAERLAGHVRTD